MTETPRTGVVPEISLLHATRGRPDACLQMRSLWLQCARNPENIEHVFALDRDDEVSLKVTESFTRAIVESPGGSGKAYNHAAAASTGRILILIADDIIPPRFWDEQILSRMTKEDVPQVLAVWDGASTSDMIGCPICTRAYYLQHPEFLGPYHGLFGDSEFSWRAYKAGCVKQARDIIFFHDHPLITSRHEEMDEIYLRQNIPLEFQRSCALFLRRNPDAIIVECDKFLWLCYQKPDGEYGAIQSLPPDIVMRTRKDFPRVDYIQKQLSAELERRIQAIQDPEVAAKMFIKLEYTKEFTAKYRQNF